MDRTPQPNQRPQGQERAQDSGFQTDALPATLSGRARQALADTMHNVEEFFRGFSDGLALVCGVDRAFNAMRREQASRMLNGKGSEEDIELLVRRMAYDPKAKTFSVLEFSSDYATDARVMKLLADARLERIVEHEASTKRQVATALAALLPSATEEDRRYFAAVTMVDFEGPWSINLSHVDRRDFQVLQALGVPRLDPHDPNLSQKSIYVELSSSNDLGRRLLSLAQDATS